MKIKVSVFHLVKLCFFAMLFYSSFLMELAEIKIANMTFILGVLTAVIMLFDMAITNYNPLNVVTSDVQRILLFTIASVLSIAVASYTSSAINGMIQLVQCLMLMVITIYICVKENSVTFCAKTIVIVMCVASLYALINAESFTERLTLSESGNANVFGHNAVLGVCLTPLAFGKDTGAKRFLQIALTVIFSMAVVISASRMSFITLVGYFAVYLILIAPRSTQHSRFSKGVKFLGALGIAVVVFLFVSQYLEGTLVIDRMNDLFNVFESGEGDGAARVYLYEEAWRMFLQSPIFGIGYANFAPMHYGVYTHSTYAEILSCTGLIGAFAFAGYYIYIFKSLKRGAKLDNELNVNTNHHLIMIFVVLLLLGIGEILIYKIKYFIVFGILAAQFYINKQQIITHEAEKAVKGEK